MVPLLVKPRPKPRTVASIDAELAQLTRLAWRGKARDFPEHVALCRVRIDSLLEERQALTR